MVVQIILLVIALFLVVALVAPTGQGRRPALSARKSVRLGWWAALLEALNLFLNRSSPTYALALSFQEKYGNLINFPIPFRREGWLLVSELTLAKKILSSPDWCSRFRDGYHLQSTTVNEQPIGLLWSRRDEWREARKLTLKILHQLDFFKKDTMERFIDLEVVEVVRELRSQIGESGGGLAALSPKHMFEQSMLNIVFQTVIGKRVSRNDPMAQRMCSLLHNSNQDFNVTFFLLDLFPWLRRLLRATPLLEEPFYEVSQFFYRYFREDMNERRRRGAYRTEPSDFADHFLLEVDKHTEVGDTCYINDDCYLVSLRDMVFAGMHTTSVALEYAIMYMAINPNVQDQVQAEIDRVIGEGRRPTYNDRNRMPYTEAVLLETQRLASIAPIIVRATTTDTYINGDLIPKGSMCAVNAYAIHRSEEIWEEPCIFRPERFLDAERQRVVNADRVLPFGYGKRVCLGEPLARASLFLFFVTLMQDFTWRGSKTHSPPSLKNLPGLIRCPAPYYVTVEKRS